VEKIPELVDALARAAMFTTDLMSKKLAEAKTFASVLNSVSPRGSLGDAKAAEGSAKY
jgi:hypothetical protein